MPSVLTRYVMRFLGLRLAVISFAVLAFALLFDLLDASGDIVGKSQAPVRDLLTYIGLRAPSLLSEMFGFATLLAGLFAVADLLRHREIIALWTAGISFAGLALRALPFVLTLIAAKYVVDDRLVPVSAERLRDWGVGRFSALGPGSSDRWLWMASDNAILRFDARAARAHRLREVAIFRRDADGRLVERIWAARAFPIGAQLRLEEVVRERLDGSPAQAQPELLFPAAVDVLALALMTRPAHELSRADLLRIIEAGGYGMTAIHPHRTWLAHRLAAALAPGLLLLLPFTLIRSFDRMGGITPLFVQGLAIGFTYQIANGLLLALGEGGFLPAGLAAWSATFALALWLAVGLLRAAGGRALLSLAPNAGRPLPCA